MAPTTASWNPKTLWTCFSVQIPGRSCVPRGPQLLSGVGTCIPRPSKQKSSTNTVTEKRDVVASRVKCMTEFFLPSFLDAGQLVLISWLTGESTRAHASSFPCLRAWPLQGAQTTSISGYCFWPTYKRRCVSCPSGTSCDLHCGVQICPSLI